MFRARILERCWMDTISPSFSLSTTPTSLDLHVGGGCPSLLMETRGRGLYSGGLRQDRRPSDRVARWIVKTREEEEAGVFRCDLRRLNSPLTIGGVYSRGLASSRQNHNL